MSFVISIIDWQRERGRHDLPWQNSRDPYRVWLSEIMLQQTQVATVIPYYLRFLSRFPTLASLADASQEEVMPYWAGLGYYARARNLHRCAQTVARDWHGRFPEKAADIANLPGIGPSTANAIAAFCYNARQPILDGNVKRVFCRYYGVDGDPQKKATEQRLWDLAWQHLEDAPAQVDMSAYTQGLMDLGATVCTRSRPACNTCPLADACIARREDRQSQLPTPRVRKAVPQRQVCMLVLEHDGKVLMYRRADKGIWGGLLTLPEFADRRACTNWLQQSLGNDALPLPLAAFEHVFTHFRLHIEPMLMHVDTAPTHLPPGGDPDHPERWQWIDINSLADAALPAPLRTLLSGYFETDAQNPRLL